VGRTAHRRNRNCPFFWKDITNNGKATRIILPTPIFFAWLPDGGGSTLVARDLSVNESARLEDSPQLADMEKRLGKPAAWRSYTFASDTFAALRLERFLDSYGVQSSISSSAEFPHQIIDYENVVAFGTTSSLTAYQSDLDRLSYKLGPYEKYVIDKRQPAGSPRQVSVGSGICLADGDAGTDRAVAARGFWKPDPAGARRADDRVDFVCDV